VALYGSSAVKYLTQEDTRTQPVSFCWGDKGSFLGDAKKNGIIGRGTAAPGLPFSTYLGGGAVRPESRTDIIRAAIIIFLICRFWADCSVPKVERFPAQSSTSLPFEIWQGCFSSEYALIDGGRDLMSWRKVLLPR